MVLPLESLARGLFHQLGSCLGGTCVGYALVIPTSYCRYRGPSCQHTHATTHAHANTHTTQHANTHANTLTQALLLL